MASASKITRHDFDLKDDPFVFGAGTSAYQIEGGYNEGGRSMSLWDVWTMSNPGMIADGSNGCVAADHYHKFKEDVKLMKEMGLDAYRFSLSWTRILPGGRLSLGVNREGIKFYNDLINALLAEGIEPYVTLFHFDVPYSLQQEYGGFSSAKIVPDFVEYAQLCFFEFGDRVTHWITINEAWSFTQMESGRATTTAESKTLTHRSLTGVEQPSGPYPVAHNLLLAHASAVDAYRKNFQAVQGGKIGITNISLWYFPLTDSDEDKAAALRAVEFMWGWFVAPVVTGDYPDVMKHRVSDRLPKFTVEQAKLVKGSYDFLGMNYYTSYYAAYKATPEGTTPTYMTDQEVEFSTKKDGIPIGEQAGSDWLFIVPKGIYELLIHTQETYDNPLVYITENGVNEKADRITVTEASVDKMRIKYHNDHLSYVKQAIDKGANVKAYFVWALIDTFEWSEGYTVRFGLFYVDFKNDLARYPKSSAIWYMNFLKKPKLLARPKRQIEELEEYDPVKRIKSR